MSEEKRRKTDTDVFHLPLEIDTISELLQNPSVVPVILKHFRCRTLMKLSRVCKTWNFYATKIVSSRTDVSFFTFCKVKSHDSSSLQPGQDEWARQFVDDLQCRPDTVICVGNGPVEFLLARLPSSCRFLEFRADDGIIGTFDDYTVKEIERPRRECWAGFCLPQITKDVDIFLLEVDDSSKLDNPIDTEQLNKALKIPEDKRIRCVVLAEDSRGEISSRKIDELLEAFWHRENGQIAFCGGVVRKLHVRGENNSVDKKHMLGLAFGGEAVRACSVLLPPDVKSRAKVAEKLLQFRAFLAALPAAPKQTFAFMFSCNGRGKKFHKKENLETSVFTELFPRIPVCGAFTCGEFGWDYIPGVTREHSPPEGCHGFTTVFAMVALL